MHKRLFLGLEFIGLVILFTLWNLSVAARFNGSVQDQKVSAGSFSTPVLLYDASNPSVGFRDPLVNSQGAVIVVNNQPSGLRLNSISSSGQFNWQTGVAGLASSRHWSPVLGSNDTIYFPLLDSNLAAYSSSGSLIPGFPVNVAPQGVANWHFPKNSPVVPDLDGQSIFVSTSQTFSFGEFPNRILALNLNGTTKWLKEYPDSGRNSAVGNLVQGPSNDVYSFLFPNGPGTFNRFDRTTGQLVCSEPALAASDQVGGGSNGIFTHGGTSIYSFAVDCTSSVIFNQTDRSVEFKKMLGGNIYATDYPVTGSGTTLISLTPSGSLRWRNTDFTPADNDLQPIKALKNGVLLVTGYGQDPQQPRLYAVDENQGTTLASLDMNSSCGGICGVAMSNNRDVYLTYADKIYKTVAPLALPPTPTPTPTPTCATTSGMVAWWKAEGNANDSVGINNGTSINGSGYTAGMVGQGFSFNGNSQYVSVPHSDLINPTNAISVEAWVKVNSMPQANYWSVVNKDNTGEFSEIFWIIFCGVKNE